MEKSTDVVHTDYVETTCPYCKHRTKYHGIFFSLRRHRDVRTCKNSRCAKKFIVGYYKGEEDV